MTSRSSSHFSFVASFYFVLDCGICFGPPLLASLIIKGEWERVPGQILWNWSRSRLDCVPKFWSRTRSWLDRFQNFRTQSRNRPGPIPESGTHFLGHFYYLIPNQPEPLDLVSEGPLGSTEVEKEGIGSLEWLGSVKCEAVKSKEEEEVTNSRRRRGSSELSEEAKSKQRRGRWKK